MREVCYVPEKETLPDKRPGHEYQQVQVVARWHLRFRRPLDAGTPGKLLAFCDKPLADVNIADQEYQIAGTALVCVACLNVLLRAIALTD